ncbi:MAG: flagellar hook-length control protein FliK [Caulobacteraceae bacterium]
MDFAAEPVMDAFTPQTRAAGRATPEHVEPGPTFEEQLQALNEAAPERPTAAEQENTSDAAAKQPEESDAPEKAEAALLGGPPVTAPPVTPVVIVQLAAASAAQPQAQSAAEASAALASAAASQAPAVTPALDTAALTPAGASSAPAAPTAKPAHAATARTTATAPAPPQSTNPSLEAAPTPNTNAAAQAIDTTSQPTASIAAEALPRLQQALASTIGATPQSNVETAQRAAKAALESAQAKRAPEPTATSAARETPNAAPRPQPNKAAAALIVAKESAAPLPAQAAPQDTTQIAQPTAVTPTGAQAGALAQHVGADTSAQQRTTPAAAQVAREIIRRFAGGATSFELRLDPPELGRVEVRMEVSRDHRVTAVIAADNPQALTELARHARELEQQLQSAGLRLSDSGLSFDLRQGAPGAETQDSSSGPPRSSEEAARQQAPALIARPIGLERWRGVRVDIMV